MRLCGALRIGHHRDLGTPGDRVRSELHGVHRQVCRVRKARGEPDFRDGNLFVVKLIDLAAVIAVLNSCLFKLMAVGGLVAEARLSSLQGSHGTGKRACTDLHQFPEYAFAARVSLHELLLVRGDYDASFGRQASHPAKAQIKPMAVFGHATVQLDPHRERGAGNQSRGV